jgi:hypothetical protein
MRSRGPGTRLRRPGVPVLRHAGLMDGPEMDARATANGSDRTRRGLAHTMSHRNAMRHDRAHLWRLCGDIGSRRDITRPACIAANHPRRFLYIKRVSALDPRHATNCRAPTPIAVATTRRSNDTAQTACAATLASIATTPSTVATSLLHAHSLARPMLLQSCDRHAPGAWTGSLASQHHHSAECPATLRPM